MSYFDFYRNNAFQDHNADTVDENIIRGMCNGMCPKEEIEMRMREHIVHALEHVGDEMKLVKSYSRPAADMNMAVPQLLRPYNILRDTMQYLLFEVATRTDAPLVTVYDFIDDRLRAVRQDMTIQRLPPKQAVRLLEPMVRFYVYFGYRLCEHPISHYDPVLNQKYLLECLKLFLNYSDNDSSKYTENVDQLSGFMTNLDIGRASETMSCDRVLMEMLYIMCNLGDVHPLVRYLNLPKNIKSHQSLVLAYKIATANLRGNFVLVAKLSQRLCPLSYYAIRVYLPVLQRNALHILSHAYHNRQLTVPCRALREWLMFNCDAELIETCKHYGLSVEGDRVHFNKADCKLENLLQPKKCLLPDKQQSNWNMEHIFTYKIS